MDDKNAIPLLQASGARLRAFCLIGKLDLKDRDHCRELAFLLNTVCYKRRRIGIHSISADAGKVSFYEHGELIEELDVLDSWQEVKHNLITVLDHDSFSATCSPAKGRGDRKRGDQAVVLNFA